MKKCAIFFVFAISMIPFVSCRKCKMCKECQWDPVTGSITSNCTQSKKYCGRELKVIEESDIFICE